MTELQRLRCMAFSLGVLLDARPGGAGLPVGYPSISNDVVGRTSADTIKKQTDYFVAHLKRCLTSYMCVQLDGACRCILALLPMLVEAVSVVVERVNGGGGLYVDVENTNR